MRGAWKAAASAVGIVAALAACSGSGGSSDPTTIASSSSTSTSVVPSTSAQTTTSTTSTSSTTSPAVSKTTATPTTTVTAEAQVSAAYLTAYGGYWACLRDPKTCDPTSLTASTGPARATLTDAVNKLRSSDLKVGPEDFGYVVIESGVVDGSSRSATVKSCWWDTGVVYGPPAKAGGNPIVVNNLQVTSRFDTTLVLESGEWRISQETRTDRVEGVNQCPPEGS